MTGRSEKKCATSALGAPRPEERLEPEKRTQVVRSTVCRARPVLGELWWLMGPKEGPESVWGGRGKNCVASASAQKM